MKTMRSLIIFIIFVHVCQWTFHHFEEFQEKKKPPSNRKKGKPKVELLCCWKWYNRWTDQNCRLHIFWFEVLLTCYHCCCCCLFVIFFFIWFCFFSVLLNSFASFVYFGHNKLECGLVFCISKISQIEIFNSIFDMKFDWLRVYKRWKWTAIFGPTLNQITDVNWHN